jgi:hypothetical protein
VTRPISRRNPVPLATALSVCAALSAWGWPAQAALTGGPDVIAAPVSVLDSNVNDVPPGATNDHQQGFTERQGVLLSLPLTVDNGVIPAGTVVDSHMIFLNVPDGSPGTADFNRTWTFDGPVLGVMSDSEGALEVASSPLLGSNGTTYPGAPFPARGLDLGPGAPNRGAGGVTSEGYTVSGNTIVVGMTVAQPGDWIRVITLGARAPDCSGVVASPGVLWPPNGKLQTVTLSGLTEPHGDSASITVTGVTQNEPVNAAGDGNTVPDVVAGLESDQVQLRAERSGGGDGRVYRISFTGTDASGATCTGTVTVSVPHDRGDPPVG